MLRNTKDTVPLLHNQGLWTNYSAHLKTNTTTVWSRGPTLGWQGEKLGPFEFMLPVLFFLFIKIGKPIMLLNQATDTFYKQISSNNHFPFKVVSINITYEARTLD